MSEQFDQLSSYCPTCKELVKVECSEQYYTNNYYPPIYDRRGLNINQDKNSKISKYKCTKCDCEIEEKIIKDVTTINGETINISNITTK